MFTGQNTLEDTYVYNRFANAVYIALLRPGWALGVCWVIFACVTGYGGKVSSIHIIEKITFWKLYIAGLINLFLSLPVFQVLSKLTYSMYLIHVTMIFVISAQTRVSVYISNLELVMHS